MIKRIQQFVSEFAAVTHMANTELALKILPEMIMDVMYEERLRTLNLLTIRGFDVDKDTVELILGDKND